MRKLHHHELSASCRMVRVTLLEKRLDFDLCVEEPWNRPDSLLALNPAGEIPVLVEAEDFLLCDGMAICEYLDEAFPDPPLRGEDVRARAEVRRLVAWFSGKFDREVTQPIIEEKLLRRMLSAGSPDSRRLRAGQMNIHLHMQYISWLIHRRRWLAGEHMSLADIAGAAHLSLVDYASDVPWDDYPEAKEWYALMKCRPSFRPLLDTWIGNVRPPRHYADLDF